MDVVNFLLLLLCILCVGNMVPELRKMAEVQLAFHRQKLHLKKAVLGHLILAELFRV